MIKVIKLYHFWLKKQLKRLNNDKNYAECTKKKLHLNFEKHIDQDEFLTRLQSKKRVGF